MDKLTFTPTGEPDSEYAVTIPVVIGTVYRSWFRFGGECWTNSRNAGCGFTTRKDAADNLLKNYQNPNLASEAYARRIANKYGG